MSSFKIEFKGLELLKQQLSLDPRLGTIVPDVTAAIELFHNSLENRISEFYNAPGKLSDVMVGHSVKPVELGNAFLRYSLQYRFKAIPLIDYKYKQSDLLAVESWAPLRFPPNELGPVAWTKGRYSKAVSVQVRKGTTKPTNIFRQPNLKGFLAYNVRSAYGTPGIYARTQKATWLQYPKSDTTGTRAPFVQLYGPSLSELASKLYDNGVTGKDPVIANAIDKVEDRIFSAFTKWYTR